MNEELKNEIISGTVEDIKFRNEQNGYTVLEIGCDDELITAVGLFSAISVGETVKCSGNWTFAVQSRKLKVSDARSGWMTESHSTRRIRPRLQEL